MPTTVLIAIILSMGKIQYTMNRSKIFSFFTTTFTGGIVGGLAGAAISPCYSTDHSIHPYPVPYPTPYPNHRTLHRTLHHIQLTLAMQEIQHLQPYTAPVL